MLEEAQKNLAEWFQKLNPDQRQLVVEYLMISLYLTTDLTIFKTPAALDQICV